MRTAILVTMRRRYADLVRLAYLALDDGAVPSETVLSTARRAVRQSARAGPGASYPQLRHRLALELLTQPPHHRRLRLRRLFVEPASTTPTPLREVLQRSSAHERLVYLLVRLEGLTSPEVAAELGEQLLVNAWDIDRTLADIDDRTDLDPASQQAELQAFDPSLVRLRPPPSFPMTARIALVLTAVVLIAAGSATYERWQNAGRPGDPLVVGDDRWNRHDVPSLDDWPTQGKLGDDRSLLRRAASAWRDDRRDPPLGRVSVMYAGRVDEATVVVMHDTPGTRDAPMVAQYFERPLSKGVESIRRLGNDSGQLIMLGTTWRYLVPPWLSDLAVASPKTPLPVWQPINVRDGVSDPLPWRWFDPDCQNYVVFRSRHKGTGSITQFASHNPEFATPVVWFRDPDPHRDDTGFTGDRNQWNWISALSCGAGIALAETGDLRLGRLWSGSLPDGGGHATLISIDASVPFGAPGMTALLSDDGRLIADRGTTNSDYSAATDTIAGAVWWRSQKRWHLLATGASGVADLKMVGELGNRDARRHGKGTLLFVEGPPVRGKYPRLARLPVVQIVVYEPDGDHSVISPS
ncbi:hypothetical protein ACGFNU_26320 [Spirillospora sp. NPDC048911]|uniref:hypothetical protein n=1 Tax=Spirillospora sp. NPDC048911 TaxID=3364527 RepID=UPI00372251E5